MKAILVKYLAPTNCNGSRWKASAEGWKSITEPMNYSLQPEQNAESVARELLNANTAWGQRWELIQGTLPNGDYVFCLRDALDYETPRELRSSN